MSCSTTRFPDHFAKISYPPKSQGGSDLLLSTTKLGPDLPPREHVHVGHTTARVYGLITHRSINGRVLQSVIDCSHLEVQTHSAWLSNLKVLSVDSQYSSDCPCKLGSGASSCGMTGLCVVAMLRSAAGWFAVSQQKKSASLCLQANHVQDERVGDLSESFAKALSFTSDEIRLYEQSDARGRGGVGEQPETLLS